MGVKISALPAVVTPALTDVFPIVQAGVTYKETVTQLSTLIGTVSVSSITGTPNQVIADHPTGDVTLSLPQSIATTSDVTFGSVAFSPTTKGIVGTTTNNDASSGYVGEFITSAVSMVPIASDTDENVTSISLTAGDWDVWGNMAIAPAGGTTMSKFAVGVSTTSDNLDGNAYTALFAAFTGAGLALPAPTIRLSLNSTTTVYLVAALSYTGSPVTVTATLSARRAR